MFEGNPLIKVLWKDHASIMVYNFIKMLQHEEFVDVHIRHAGRMIAAHRAVLAASSELFRTRLASPVAPVTTVELGSLQCAAGLLRAKGPDAVFTELELIIQIVYRGWADLRERSIASLLDTARCLQFTDVCEVLQRTMQARANATLSHHLQHVQQLLPPQPAVSGAECLEQMVVGEVALRALQEVMLSSEPSCLFAPELAEELTHLTPLLPVQVERRADTPPPPLPSPLSPPGSGLRHEDAAGLTAAGLCEEVVQQPPIVELADESPQSAVSDAGGAAGNLTEPAEQERYHEQEQQQAHQEQDQQQEQEQERPHGSQDGAPLLRVRTQFELHCPWGLDMELAGRQRHEPDQGSGFWSDMLMPAPPPPPPPPAAATTAPLLPDGGARVVAEEEQAFINSCVLPPSTPETVERFDENDFSGLTEEEKSPMPPKAARVRRLRRRAAPRIRTRNIPALISLDQSTVCQVCHLDFGRMAALQRHLASAHADRAAAAPTDERPPASTVDASAIADPRDTCDSLLQFRPRLTAAAAGGDAAVSVSEEQRTAGGLTAEGSEVTPSGGDGGAGEARVPVGWAVGSAVMMETAERLTAEAAVPAAREGGHSEPGVVPEPGRTQDGSGWPGDGVAAVVVRQECEETLSSVMEGEQGWIAVEQQGEHDWTAAEEQTGQTAGVGDRATKFKCVECSFSAATMPVLGAHMKRDHSPSLVCPHCQLQFRQAAALYRHIATSHPNLPDRPSQCTICAYQSARPSQVRRHLRDVHGQDVQGRPLSLDHCCQQCNYATCSARKLKVHVSRQHTTEKQFKCSECSYSSVEKQALAKHFRIVHTDERPYRCEICDFRTSTLSRISRHRRSHTQERPHVCTTCGQKYADRRRLREHVLLRHEPACGADPTPFVCPVCGGKFARRDNMLMHMRNKHKAGVVVS